MQQKGSSDVKGSLWNHLDKRVLLWHRKEPFFYVYECMYECIQKNTMLSLQEK